MDTCFAEKFSKGTSLPSTSARCCEAMAKKLDLLTSSQRSNPVCSCNSLISEHCYEGHPYLPVLCHVRQILWNDRPDLRLGCLVVPIANEPLCTSDHSGSTQRKVISSRSTPWFCESRRIGHVFVSPRPPVERPPEDLDTVWGSAWAVMYCSISVDRNTSSYRQSRQQYILAPVSRHKSRWRNLARLLTTQRRAKEDLTVGVGSSWNQQRQRQMPPLERKVHPDRYCRPDSGQQWVSEWQQNSPQVSGECKRHVPRLRFDPGE